MPLEKVAKEDGQQSTGSTVEMWLNSSGQSYKGSTIVNYDSRVVPDWKTLHITTLES